MKPLKVLIESSHSPTTHEFLVWIDDKYRGKLESIPGIYKVSREGLNKFYICVDHRYDEDEIKEKIMELCPNE